jgi:4,5-DOPA dioxygenase extradiol
MQFVNTFCIILFITFIFIISTIAQTLQEELPFEQESPPMSNFAYKPTTFISITHGGGPMPLLGNDPATVAHWAKLKEKYLTKPETKPDIIILISAHYHARSGAKVLGVEAPRMIYDYGGFPKESYSYQFPAPGHPHLAEQLVQAMKKHPYLAKNGGAELDTKWGYDHGTFVPMLKFYPQADIPIVPVSVSSTDDVETQLAIGESIRDVLAESAKVAAAQNVQPKNVAVIGSGSVPHNFNLLLGDPNVKVDGTFNRALKALLTDPKLTKEERREHVLNWRSLPKNELYQPVGAADHFSPLLSVIAAADYRVPDSTEDYGWMTYPEITDYIWNH